ncbi:MAG: tRNA lysidine(34) synthetase TilS [Dehalococcoidales bacterium]|nr:tRNA lysidine(34) synthetase TilS [Dehalococcoidales bacterium]
MKGENQPSLEQRVLGFIQEHQLISDGEKLVVAVSGGADSVCLIHILANLQEELKLKLHIAHLNHQLRGAESEADASYVADLARQLAIPATMEKRDVKGYQARERLSLEEAAREVRYSFLAQVAGAIGAERVAVGHTRDDQIETILMHLIRGSGTRGLRGLQPATLWQSGVDSLTIIRPLLEISHQETENYCHQHRLTPRLDASNLSLSPLRNRIRQQLLPLLESYNPGVTEALLRTGRIAGDDIDFLDEQVTRLWDEVARQEKKSIILDKKGFDQLPPTLKRYLLRALVERLLGSAKDIEMRHVEEMMSLATKAAGKRLSLPGGLTFSVEYNRYLLTSDLTALSPLPLLKGEFPLNIPGETRLPGWRVEATIIKQEEMSEKDDFTAYLDLAKSGDRLMVRPRRRGDRFQPLGLAQPKKLGEFMIDAKIPNTWRGQIPIVCSEEQILWVVGWRLDERAKVSRDTKQVLRLEFKPG